MIIDKLFNAHLYSAINPGVTRALDFLASTDLTKIETGKHVIDGDNLFAIVQEYDTMDRATEKMEAHKKYIDVQYVISGAEMVGHSLLHAQIPVKQYDEQEDYMLFGDQPDFFSEFSSGTFMVFFPGDLHMPCISDGTVQKVKKIVLKVKVLL